jgi:chemotaxis signal transduction protein
LKKQMNESDIFELDETARHKSDQTLAPQLSQYLVFSVSGREMAISLAQVSEVVPYERVCNLPGTPDYLRGVTEVRGRWTPVIDLGLKLGLAATPITKRSCILVLELEIHGESLPVGMVLDGVATLLELDDTRLSPPPRFGAGVEVRYMQGLIATERGSLPLIDFAHVFAGSELEHIVAGASQANNQASLTP